MLATIGLALRYALYLSGFTRAFGLVCVVAWSCSKSAPKPQISVAEISGPEISGPMTEVALMADVRLLSGPAYLGRGSYQPGSAKASAFVFDELQSLGFQVLRQPVQGRYAENIIAFKKGDEQAVMVSTHHDHLGQDASGALYPGADDNASGVAVFLAIARSRAQMNYQHTIIFASFGAEEDGLVGSGLYVRDPLWPLSTTKAVINFDMVGRNFFEAGSNLEAAVAVVGLEDVPQLGDSMHLKAASLGLTLIDAPARLLELFDLHDRTDDWWFRRQGIPSIHFSTGLHGDYHKVSDTAEKIVPSQLARVAETAGFALDALAVRVGEEK